jgi:cell division protein FtsB
VDRRAEAAETDPAQEPTTPLAVETPPRAAFATGRFIAVVCVLLFMVLFYAPTLRVYLDQSHEIAQAQDLIRERAEEIARLEKEIARWDDPAFIRTQARDRLGWVTPGETGYHVVDSEGNPISGDVSVQTTVGAETNADDPWWSKMWGAIAAADNPA